MSKKAYLLIAVLIVLALSACSRSAVDSPVATATSRVQGANATPGAAGVATEDPMALVKLFATQTAMASGATIATPTLQSGVILPSLTPAAGVGTPVVVTTPVPSTVVNPTPYPTTVKPAQYSLQAGEYPYCLARRFDVDPDELLTLNNLSENSLLQPGQTINIPQSGGVFPGARAMHTHPTTYVVAVNDTIYRIGCYFGDVDPMAIAAVNHLVAPYTLTVGQTLSIP